MQMLPIAYLTAAALVVAVGAYLDYRHQQARRNRRPAFKTGYEWESITGIMVVDPTGWTKRGLNYGSSLITVEQHKQYAAESGCRHRKRQLPDIFA